MTGQQMLEAETVLLRQVPEGEEAEELCEQLKEWQEEFLNQSSESRGPASTQPRR